MLTSVKSRSLSDLSRLELPVVIGSSFLLLAIELEGPEKEKRGRGRIWGRARVSEDLVRKDSGGG